MSNSYSVLFSILRKLQIHKLYRAIEDQLPSWANLKIREVTLKNVFIPLVDVKELEREYTKALIYLMDKIGDNNVGDYLEFGVSRGSSLGCMHKVLKDLGLESTRLLGFDSFEGMPESARYEDLGKWKPGQYASPIEYTKIMLTEQGVDWSRTFLIKGWYSNTLSTETIDNYSVDKATVIMIDCDIYSSAKQSLDFCVPLIKDSAIIFFDDWFDNTEFGEDRAFREFLMENPQFTSIEFGSYLPCGRSFLITSTGFK